ncbi:unnamed protein product, partial [Polarella glacialis]
PCWFQLPLHSPRLRQHWVHDEEQGPITWHCRQPVSGRSRQHRQRTDQHPSLLVAAPSWPHGSICSAAVVAALVFDRRRKGCTVARLAATSAAGSNGSSSDESDRVTIEVPKALLKLMPSHVRADSKLRDRYLPPTE